MLNGDVPGVPLSAQRNCTNSHAPKVGAGLSLGLTFSGLLDIENFSKSKMFLEIFNVPREIEK